MGWRGRGDEPAVERFMRRYFLVARDVGALLRYAEGDERVNAARAGVVGYCMSGPFALYAAAEYAAQFRAAASFYGVRLHVDKSGRLLIAQYAGPKGLRRIAAQDLASGEVKVRIAPKGAEPLIAMAGEGGKLQSRNTRAEDLAQAVADTALTKARLEKEHARLLSYQDRKDLKIEDLMAIADAGGIMPPKSTMSCMTSVQITARMPPKVV